MPPRHEHPVRNPDPATQTLNPEPHQEPPGTLSAVMVLNGG